MTNSWDLNLIRQHIREMPSYEPILPFEVLSDELGIPREKLIKLDANENPYGPIREVQETLGRLDTIHIYPDPENRKIRSMLAEYHQIPQESIVIGAGADELIDLITRIVIEPGDRVLNCPPTFGMYAFDSALNQGNLISVPRHADFSIDYPKILQQVDERKPKVMFLANPNNPDGGTISRDAFQKLINLPLLLVIDEAYVDFCDRGRSYIEEVSDYLNLIVLRTFSKWAGLAGLRIGYGIFPEYIVPTLMKAKQPYNVSVAAEHAAFVSMKNIEKTRANVMKIVEQRESVYESLSHISWLKPYPSQANFILCCVDGISALEVTQRLRVQGILVRHFNKPGLSDHIRISIGTKKQNETLIAALKEIR
ncbi:MAG: histidinol-phosphate transaminase [Anaerolineales bacterium]|jgi:histidinol-phosphate aminotransferase